MRKKIVAVIGNKKIEEDGIRRRLAYETGKILVDNGYRVQSAGMGRRDGKRYSRARTLRKIIGKGIRLPSFLPLTRKLPMFMPTSSSPPGWI